MVAMKAMKATTAMKAAKLGAAAKKLASKKQAASKKLRAEALREDGSTLDRLRRWVHYGAEADEMADDEYESEGEKDDSGSIYHTEPYGGGVQCLYLSHGL